MEAVELNPIPEDQRYIVFPIEDPDTGRIDECGWEWMDRGRDDPMWNDYTPGWEPLICELVPVAEIDRLRAIEAELDQTQDDLVYALHTRNLVLERAAAEVLPGPDGQDDIDRRALIERWVNEAHDEAGMTPRPLPSVDMLRQLGPNVGEVIRELDRLRAGRIGIMRMIETLADIDDEEEAFWSAIDALVQWHLDGGAQ